MVSENLSRVARSDSGLLALKGRTCQGAEIVVAATIVAIATKSGLLRRSITFHNFWYPQSSDPGPLNLTRRPLSPAFRLRRSLLEMGEYLGTFGLKSHCPFMYFSQYCSKFLAIEVDAKDHFCGSTRKLVSLWLRIFIASIPFN